MYLKQWFNDCKLLFQYIHKGMSTHQVHTPLTCPDSERHTRVQNLRSTTRHTFHSNFDVYTLPHMRHNAATYTAPGIVEFDPFNLSILPMNPDAYDVRFDVELQLRKKKMKKGAGRSKLRLYTSGQRGSTCDARALGYSQAGDDNWEMDVEKRKCHFA